MLCRGVAAPTTPIAVRALTPSQPCTCCCLLPRRLAPTVSLLTKFPRRSRTVASRHSLSACHTPRQASPPVSRCHIYAVALTTRPQRSWAIDSHLSLLACQPLTVSPSYPSTQPTLLTSPRSGHRLERSRRPREARGTRASSDSEANRCAERSVASKAQPARRLSGRGLGFLLCQGALATCPFCTKGIDI